MMAWVNSFPDYMMMFRRDISYYTCTLFDHVFKTPGANHLNHLFKDQYAPTYDIGRRCCTSWIINDSSFLTLRIQ